MDIRLPDESGLQLTKKIKAKCPLTSIAILTSHDSSAYRQAAKECGASHFFVKGASDGCEIQSFVKRFLPVAARLMLVLPAAHLGMHTQAIIPALDEADNVQPVAVQHHAGSIRKCAACR